MDEFAGESTNNNFQTDREGEIDHYFRKTVLFCIFFYGLLSSLTELEGSQLFVGDI